MASFTVTRTYVRVKAFLKSRLMPQVGIQTPVRSEETLLCLRDMRLRSAIACIVHCDGGRDCLAKYPPVSYFGTNFRNGKKDCLECRSELCPHIGSIAGHEANSTLCPHCEKTIIKRVHLTVSHNVRRGV